MREAGIPKRRGERRANAHEEQGDEDLLVGEDGGYFLAPAP